jgi:hypothetical protein
MVDPEPEDESPEPAGDEGANSATFLTFRQRVVDEALREGSPPPPRFRDVQDRDVMGLGALGGYLGAQDPTEAGQDGGDPAPSRAVGRGSGGGRRGRKRGGQPEEGARRRPRSRLGVGVGAPTSGQDAELQLPTAERVHRWRRRGRANAITPL